jgi:hypothetical protein
LSARAHTRNSGFVVAPALISLVFKPIRVIEFSETFGQQLNPNMKKQLLLIATLALALNLTPAHGQFAPRGPRFDATLSKLFGDNSAFSAVLEFQTKDGGGEAMNMPGKIAFLESRSRFEMDMTQLKGGKMPPEAAAQMKAMGMGSMIIISRPDKKLAYMIYPGLQAYVENETKDAEDPKVADQWKIDITELGKETMQGHPCVKNKVIVTDNKGDKHESTVWNATDLKKFPVKIETSVRNTETTMLFKEIKLAKPDGALFDAPKDFKRYDNMQSLIQEEMMKRAGGLPNR